MTNMFLIRHAESEKNTGYSFAAKDGSEGLTREGGMQADLIQRTLAEYEAISASKIALVASSTSVRSSTTAAVIASGLHCSTETFSDLASIGSGVLAGKAEAEAWKSNPDYMKALELYRAGLFNSYHIPEFEGKEGKIEFEERVTRVLNILADRRLQNVAVVSQRSPITAMLLHVARKSYRYPDNFFGHVPLDLGQISWIERTTEGWSIHGVNLSPGELLSRAVPAKR